MVQLGEICDFLYGESLKAECRIHGNVPVYGSNGVVGWHDEAITDGPTIIIGRKGSIGEINWSDHPCFPIDTTYYVRKTKKPCNLRWLYFTLVKLDLTRLNKSAAVPGLNRDDAYRQMIPFPKLNEQEAIARYLDKADLLRRKRRYALELSDTFLQSVFLEMFGDPIRNPQGWDRESFCDIGKLDRGKSKHRPRNAPHLYGGKYPFVQTGDIANCANYVKEHHQTYSEEGLKQSKLWPAGTLCITIAANIAKTGILTYPACFPDSVVGFLPNEKVTTEFVQYWLAFLQTVLERTAPESAQKNINLEILRELPVPIPPITLQGKFREVVRFFEQLREKQRESLRQAEHLFQTLLHQAFKGER
jgi:type I restriction enzyme S subunit